MKVPLMSILLVSAVFTLPVISSETFDELSNCADTGDATCQFKLGEIYNNGEGVSQSYSKAVNWYLKAAEQGMADAQFELYIMYYWGFGVCRDRDDFDEWDRLASEQGHPNTISNEEGQNLEPVPNACSDLAEAIKWLKKASEQRHVEAMTSLGQQYISAEYLPEDYSEAIKWLRLAAEEGSANAQHTLGYLYDQGEGVAEDETEATRLYRLAAEQVDDWWSQYSLGRRYLEGIGVPKDYAEAYFWLNLAATCYGDADTIRYRELAASKLSPKELIATQERTTKWSQGIQRRSVNCER